MSKTTFTTSMRFKPGKYQTLSFSGGDIVVVEQSGVRVAFKEIGALMPFAMFATLILAVRWSSDAGRGPNERTEFKF